MPRENSSIELKTNEDYGQEMKEAFSLLGLKGVEIKDIPEELEDTGIIESMEEENVIKFGNVPYKFLAYATWLSYLSKDQINSEELDNYNFAKEELAKVPEEMRCEYISWRVQYFMNLLEYLKNPTTDQERFHINFSIFHIKRLYEQFYNESYKLKSIDTIQATVNEILPKNKKK